MPVEDVVAAEEAEEEEGEGERGSEGGRGGPTDTGTLSGSRTASGATRQLLGGCGVGQGSTERRVWSDSISVANCLLIFGKMASLFVPDLGEVQCRVGSCKGWWPRC